MCVVYPNNYQSSDIGFKLADPTKPGHCKALVFYLANPVRSVPSTAIVPPQQQTWWKHEIMKSSPIADLPSLITNIIFRYIEWPFSVNDAVKIREQTAEFEYYEEPEDNDQGFEMEFYYDC
ncbi:hypothetical protein GGI05_001197 [Coemansia sp. RSA 2603]|nr:hypothetical protein GGI05_001197 [Coemansia sp. RSA 2603]